MLTKLTITNENPLWYRLNRTDFDQISFNFKEGVNVIIGRNGIGKSTVVKAISQAWIENKPNANNGIHQESKKINDLEKIFVLTAEENNPKNQLATISPTDPHYYEKTIHWFGRSELSSGMRTKEQFLDAMELAKEARLVILDEPEQALDAEALLHIKKELKKMASQTQFIIVSHHPAFILDDDFNILEFDPERPYKPAVEALVKTL